MQYCIIVSMIKEELIRNLHTVISKLGLSDIAIDLEHPINSDHGDYSTSIALKISKKLKKNPFEIAQMIIDSLPKVDFVEKVEAVKPGFINFRLSNEYVLKQVLKIETEHFIFPTFYLGKNKKIMVEYAHPNTHKLFHIGHLRNITTGESIVRILEAVGNKVIRSNYQGDVGLHIAKCLYGIQKSLLRQGFGGQAKIKNLKTLKEKTEFIGKMYTEGTRAYEEDENAKKEIIEMNRFIYNKDPKIMSLWKETRQWSIDYFNEIYKRVYSHFDRFYFESELPERGIEISESALKKRILEKSEGAIVFNGKKYGLDTRVFINSLGFPTYEGKELALAEKEFSEFGELDKCIHVVTPEQTSFFKVTFKVEELLDEKKYKNKQYHLVYEWVNLKEGKMSSREGNIIEGNWLINEAKKKIIELFKCNEDVAEILAVASIKYSFLKNGVSNPIAFDFKESVSLEGNSGSYLLYAYVRTQSILKKEKPSKIVKVQGISKDEQNILHFVNQFASVVEKAAQNFSPNYIATYLFELAQQFNLFYQKYPVLKADKDIKQFRLLLTQSVGQILKKGLDLLGIRTVNQM